jgi:hypothetical protein
MSVSIGLDAVWELSEPGVRGELGPTGQVEDSLRLKVRKLDGDGHGEKIRHKWKKA